MECQDIYKYLNPNSNDIITTMNNSDRVNIMLSLRKYYLELRESLNIDNHVTFGTEIEFEDANRSDIESELASIFPDGSWKVVDDGSLYQGGEINSPVLRDTEKTWLDLSTVCNIVNKNAQVLENTSAHVHIGMHILGNNPKYWRNFAFIWMTYENIITRFLYGEYVSPREGLQKYATPIARDLIDDFVMLEKYSNSKTAIEILKKLNKTDEKRRSINFRHIGKTPLYNYGKEAEKNTIEFRGANGTFNPIIWQNNINLLVKILEYCKSDNFNDEIINRRLQTIEVNEIPSNIFKYGQTNIAQAIEFADLIFTNNLDKLYFLKQYIKDYKTSMVPLTKSEPFTKQLTL